MTDLQVRFNIARETERANRANEALKAQQVSLQERETMIKEAKLPYEVQEILSKSDLNTAQTSKVLEEINKVKAEIERINADTALTEQQRQNEIAKTVRNWEGVASDGLGIANGLIDTITNFLFPAKGVGKHLTPIITKMFGN